MHLTSSNLHLDCIYITLTKFWKLKINWTCPWHNFSLSLSPQLSFTNCVQKTCSQLLFIAFARNFCSQHFRIFFFNSPSKLICTVLVYNSCLQLLFTSLFSTDVHNSCSKLFFTTYTHNPISHFLFEFKKKKVVLLPDQM